MLLCITNFQIKSKLFKIFNNSHNRTFFFFQMKKNCELGILDYTYGGRIVGTVSPNLVWGKEVIIMDLALISKGHLKYFQLLTYEVTATFVSS